MKKSMLKVILLLSSFMVFSGCCFQDPKVEYSIDGRWRDAITGNFFLVTVEEDIDIDVVSVYNSENEPLYFMSNAVLYKDSYDSGIIYGQFTSDARIREGATVNQWYAFRYSYLLDDSVTFQDFLINGVDSLEEAKKVFTAEPSKLGSTFVCKREM